MNEVIYWICPEVTGEVLQKDYPSITENFYMKKW